MIRTLLLFGRESTPSENQASSAFPPLFVRVVRASVSQLGAADDIPDPSSLPYCLEYLFQYFIQELELCEDGKDTCDSSAFHVC